MGLLVGGLIIWTGVHLFPSILPAVRARLIRRLGLYPYQGLFALCILAGLWLIVAGWRGAMPIPLYQPPAGLRLPAAALIVVGLIFVVAASFPATRIKRILRHPQLTGVLLWALAHLALNGDSRSVLLFATIAAWSAVSMLTINRRDGIWIKPGPPDGWAQDVMVLVGGLGLSALTIYFHGYFAGVALVG